MKKILSFLFVLAIAIPFTAGAYNGVWEEQNAGRVPTKGLQLLHPEKYRVFSMNDAYIGAYLFLLSDKEIPGQIIELPTPDGEFREFAIRQYHMMEPGLEKKYPSIRTFTAYAIDDPRVSANIDYSPKGLHAMVMEPGKTYFVDPYSRINDGNYICYYKHDYIRPSGQRMSCGNIDENDLAEADATYLNGTGLPRVAYKTLNGTTLRNYRLALACTGEYAAAVDGPTPTIAGVLAAITTSVNRINQVYNLELGITLTLVANEDTLIFLDANTDPYTNNNGNTMLGQNQTTCTNRIGSANYDMGHVFSTGGGGIASLGCVCKNSNKAQGVTGSPSPVGDAFDIDYVAHEMGHQFGGPHTFNNNTNGSCSGNASSSSAYEPSSGTTIMAYAGICSPDDIQPHSDPYFHARTLGQISAYVISTPTVDNCPTKTTSADKPSGVPAFTSSYTIPYKTPFEITAPVVIDSAVADTLNSYCWEEWNLGDFGKTFATTYLKGPIFRSFNPTASRTRIFPTLTKLLAGVTNYTGEKLPDTTRFLTFKLTTRATYQGKGCINIPDDTIHLDAVSTGAAGSYQGFKVTSPATAVSWVGGTQKTVTWNVVGTNAAPVSCDSVNIFISIDGGYTWPYMMGRFPNNGSANFYVPNVATNNLSRVKVKGNQNVFFNLNATNFQIAIDTTLDTTLPSPTDSTPVTVDTTHGPNSVNEMQSQSGDIKVYPVPSDNTVHISINNNDVMEAIVYDAVGKAVWRGTISRQQDINVSAWAKGAYYLQLTNDRNGNKFTRPIIVR